MKSIVTVISLLCASFGVAAERPNIIFILCDDLGYGDIQCLNPENGKILTPAVDKLAEEGMIFSDSHSGSSVCSPTSYGVMTGRYSWRTLLQSRVAPQYKPNLIAEDRPTVASFLKKQGYHTGIIGKWHLSFQYTDPATGEKLNTDRKTRALTPIGSEIPDGPIHRGFDYYHGFHHAASMQVVIANDVINMLPRLTSKAVEYIGERPAQKETPFFLCLPISLKTIPKRFQNDSKPILDQIRLSYIE